MRAGTAVANDLSASGFRLDASYHANEGSKAFSYLRKWSAASLTHRLDLVGNVCLPGGIFIGGRAKRIYVDDPEHGIPFLSSSDMLLASFDGVKLISQKQPELESLLLRHSWILISRSGTIGNTTYVRRDMEGLAGSEHIMRVVADTQKIPSGYLYAFLSSPIGVSMIRQGTFGAVVDTIAPEYIASLPIPRLEPAKETCIHQLIEQAAELRVKANHRKQEALEAASKLLSVNLSAFPASQIFAKHLTGDAIRLESTYHVALETTLAIFRKCKFHCLPIGDLLTDIFYLGKLHRVFVDDPRYGVALLSISDAQKSKLTSDKYVSKTGSRNVKQAILQKGWVLISRTGTPGVVVYVRREAEGMAGTDHLVRLVADQSKILPGYLFTVLNSSIGRCMLVGSAHGSVQLMLPPEYIVQLEIPLPPVESQRPIHNLIEDYGEKLTLASELEDQAQQALVENIAK